MKHPVFHLIRRMKSVQSSTDKVDSPYLPKTISLSDVFIGAIVGNRDEEAIPWLYVSDLSSVSVCGSFPKSHFSPRKRWGVVVWFPALRILSICRCPSVAFSATSHSWIVCRESRYNVLTWHQQAILRYGDCHTLVTSQWLAEAAWSENFVLSSPQ